MNGNLTRRETGSAKNFTELKLSRNREKSDIAVQEINQEFECHRFQLHQASHKSPKKIHGHQTSRWPKRQDLCLELNQPIGLTHSSDRARLGLYAVDVVDAEGLDDCAVGEKRTERKWTNGTLSQTTSWNEMDVKHTEHDADSISP